MGNFIAYFGSLVIKGGFAVYRLSPYASYIPMVGIAMADNILLASYLMAMMHFDQ